MKTPIHIFVLIDALGSACRPAQSFMAERLPFRQSLKTVLGFSSGAVPTILTGELPCKTGHWNLFYYDPELSPFRWLRSASFLPDGIMGHRVTRRLLTETGRRVLGLGPLFEASLPPRQLPLFNFVEKRNLFAPGGVSGAPTIFDRLEAARVRYRVYSYHHQTDAEILDSATADVRDRRAEVFFLYLSEMDGFLHFHCGDDAAVAERLRVYERKLSALFDLAGSGGRELTFSIFSDHGMAPVKSRVDLAGEIDRLGLRAGADFLSVYDSTMARFWFFSEAARAAVTACLGAQSCGRIVPDAELKTLGVHFPDHRFGELVFLLHPGGLIAKSHFNGGGWNPVGMHGYHPDDPDSSAIFLSNVVRPPMSHIKDIFPAMAESAALGVQ
ncbi:MAG TPA: alkaline phosphatase family protein [Terriglobales bacterium]|jgi:hypothetical protein